jgi:NAD(P)-dependent dehydrogenase (short-subunit alcohol dehydrogenase family)
VVTGSSRGIGEAIAIEFAKAGYNVIIISRKAEHLRISREEILRNANDSDEVVTFPGDVSQEEVCSNIMDKAE